MLESQSIEDTSKRCCDFFDISVAELFVPRLLQRYGFRSIESQREMMGLAYFMLDQSKEDAEYCTENTFNTFVDINASWCGLWWIEMLKTSGQDKEGVGVCFHFSYEESLHSAVMLAPIMLRKCRFHFILSGDLYKKWDQSNGAMDPKVPKEFVSVHKEDLIHTIQHTQRGSMLSKTIGKQAKRFTKIREKEGLIEKDVV
ncbi:hypothetical protein Lser_V15G35750 [Lactuca serriola]